jgi:hypothetical protein
MTRRKFTCPRSLLIALLVGVAVLVCSCGSIPAQRPDPASAKTPENRGQPALHAINLFGSAAPPLLRLLAHGQTSHLPQLSFTYGPEYQHGRVVGLAISYAGCERIKGATVAETPSTVKVTVFGTTGTGNCVGSLSTSTAAVRLANPFGHRKEIQG